MNPRYEKLLSIHHAFATRAAECAAYAESWGSEFVKDELHGMAHNESWSKGRPIFENAEFTIADFKTLTNDELMIVGFRKWNSDQNWLVPLYLLHYIKTGEMGISISGKLTPVEKWDNDHRAGALAYYFTR